MRKLKAQLAEARGSMREAEADLRALEAQEQLAQNIAKPAGDLSGGRRGSSASDRTTDEAVESLNCPASAPVPTHDVQQLENRLSKATQRVSELEKLLIQFHNIDDGPQMADCGTCTDPFELGIVIESASTAKMPHSDDASPLLSHLDAAARGAEALPA